MLRVLLAGLLAAAVSTAQSQLTTTFANNNGGAVGGALYFDLDVTAPAVTIVGLDLNLSGTGSVEVYTIAGTRLGNQTNQPAWTLVATGAVTGAIAGVQSPVGIAPFTLPAGSYGVALKTVGVSHSYTNGNGSNQVYSTTDLTLSAGEASNVSFTAPLITPRVVNTNIRYLIGAQVGIPAHSSVYNGYTRGFNFTAATSFTIRELALPAEAFQAGDTASYVVRVNGAVAFRSIGNAGAVTPNLNIATGDVVDILGNWSPAVPASFTAHNSYSAAVAPYATTIQGVPHTLNRTGWQWDIGDPTWVDTGTTGTYLAPTSGALGRVIMTTAGTTTATNASLGVGCGATFGSFYELMSAAAFDLGNSSVTLFPNGSGGYNVTRLGSLLAVGSTAVPVNLALTDDSETTVNFTSGSFPGWTGVTVCSNGFISKASGNGTNFTPVVNTLLNAPQDAFWSWHDFNPSAAGSGQVKIEQSAGRTVITWDGVYDFATNTPNTLQFQLYPTGVVTIAWGNISGNGNSHLVGYSPGGASPNPGGTDISALGAGTIVLQGPEVFPLTLAATSRPFLGGHWNLAVTEIPPTALLGVDVLGLSDPGINDLAFIGAPGCPLRTSLDLLDAWIVTGATHGRSFSVPNNTALLNVNVYATSAVFQSPPVNAFGAITSNGMRGRIGNL